MHQPVICVVATIHLVFSIQYIENTRVEESLYKVISYDIKPYVFRDANGEMSGILPEIAKLVEFYCSQHIPNNTRLLEYAVELKEVTELSELFHSNVSYGDGVLENVTAENSLWFPYFNYIQDDDLEMFTKRNVTNIHLTEFNNLLVIMESWKLSVGYKMLLGLYDCHVLFSLMFCFSILCAFFTWSIERNINDNISRSFYRGFGNSFWLVIVTLVTVGYGDIAPKHKLSKVLLMVWMFVGLFLSSLLTASVLDTINNKESLEINGKKVAVVSDSYELHFVEHNYNSHIITTQSNGDAVELVRKGEAFAAVMNADIASWYNEEILHPDDVHGRLSFAYTLPVRIPIAALLNKHNPYTAPIMSCMKTYWSEIVVHSVESFKRYLHIETSRNETVKSVLHYSVYQVIFALTILALLLGVSFEHGSALLNRRQMQQQKV